MWYHLWFSKFSFAEPINKYFNRKKLWVLSVNQETIQGFFQFEFLYLISLISQILPNFQLPFDCNLNFKI